MSIRVDCHSRVYPIRGVFRISRGAKTQAHAVVVSITDGEHTGVGECVPYPHYGESVSSVIAQIASITPQLRDGLQIHELQMLLPSGAARNAVDCALWALRSRRSGLPCASYAGLAGPLNPVTTAFTLSLGTPEEMAEAARAQRDMPLLKLKLGGGAFDVDRVRAVREAAPRARLMADANESWSEEDVHRNMPLLALLGVELLEQPLPANGDTMLAGYKSPVPLAADESCRDRRSLADIRGKYAFANIKLDKAGGLTEALALAAEARETGMKVMVGCMVASSLSMAPGLVLAQGADIVHLDGPLLLAQDAQPALRYETGVLYPDAAVWAA
jgi:L-Ala-D/L-Glu epimerase